MFGERRLGRARERLAGILACFSVSMTALAVEPRRHDAAQDSEALEADLGDARDAKGADERKSKRVDLGRMRELTILGGVVTGLGVAGLAVGIAGVALGHVKQTEADAKQLPAQQDEVDELDKEGARANKMALAGFVAGGSLAVVGVVLLTVGAVMQRRGKTGQVARFRVEPMGFHRGSGVLLQGRF